MHRRLNEHDPCNGTKTRAEITSSHSEQKRKGAAALNGMGKAQGGDG